MEYKHFGILLQELRTKYNMSREKLAQDICTSKQIYRIEKGESEPSIYLLYQLSIKFNLDLNDYYKMHFTRNTLEGLEGIRLINNALKSNDLHLLKSLICNLETMEDFKSGENLQHIYYGKALCSALLENDYKTSLDFCYKGIRIEYPSFNVLKISENMYSNVSLALLNCISQNFIAMNEHYKGMLVLTELLAVLEFYVIDSPYPLLHGSQFPIKFYQLILYNMSDYFFEQGDIKKSLDYVEKGIAISLKEYNFRYLPDLIFMKFKLLYYDHKYDEAKEYYKQAISLYKITNKESALTELDCSAIINFPEIFK